LKKQITIRYEYEDRGLKVTKPMHLILRQILCGAILLLLHTTFLMWR